MLNIVNEDWHTVSTAVAPEARSTKGGLEEDGVSCMAVSPDRTLLVAGCTNGAVRLFRYAFVKFMSFIVI